MVLELPSKADGRNSLWIGSHSYHYLCHLPVHQPDQVCDGHFVDSLVRVSCMLIFSG